MLAEMKSDAMGDELGLKGVVELASGYQRAQVLFVANALNIFRILSDGSKSAEEVARELGCEKRGVAALLDACVALKLLSFSGKGYQNSRTAKMFLVPGRETSFSPVLRFWQQFSYGTWGRLEQAVRDNLPQTASGPKPKDLFEQLLEDAGQSRVFFDGLAGLAYWPARKIAEIVDFPQRVHLLDVGGGSGAFSEAIAKRHPHLRVTLFDLEPVCTLARERLAKSDLNGRFEAVPGDFYRDPLPGGADCVLLANVLHDWSSEECCELLKKVHTSLAPAGEVVIYEVMPAEGSPLPEVPLFSLALLLDTRRGRVYSSDEIQSWLEGVGFHDIQRLPVVGGTSLVTAIK